MAIPGNSELLPIYDLAPSSRCTLYDGPCYLNYSDAEGPGEAEVWYSSNGSLAWRARGSPHAQQETDGGLDGLVMTKLSGQSLPVLVSHSGGSSGGDWWAEGSLKHVVLGDPSAPASAVRFQLLNLPPYLSLDTPGNELDFSNDEWQIRIGEVPDLKHRNHRLLLEPSRAVTHAGVLRRIDSGVFSPSEGYLLLEAFSLLLSFCAGDTVAPLLPVAFDGMGKPVSEEWGEVKVGEYRGRLSWCCSQTPEAMVALWPRFHTLWSDPTTSALLKFAVRTYTTAQQGYLETRMTAACSGLESLAWHLLVHEGGSDVNQIDKQSGAWRVRRCLVEASVSEYVPDTLASIQRFRQYDGPNAIFGFRNAILHPTDVAGVINLDAALKLDYLRLAMWYYELLLLKLLGFEGVYLNRTDHLPIFDGRDECEPVPWA